jgi:hypothetical protein
MKLDYEEARRFFSEKGFEQVPDGLTRRLMLDFFQWKEGLQMYAELHAGTLAVDGSGRVWRHQHRHNLSLQDFKDRSETYKRSATTFRAWVLAG